MDSKKFIYVALDGDSSSHIVTSREVLIKYVSAIENPQIITFKNLNDAEEWVKKEQGNKKTQIH